MQIFIVQAEHPTVPGIVLKSFATRAAAVAEAVELVNLIAGTPAATADNWETVLEGLQDEHGAEHCDVWITEQEVQGTPSDAPAPDPVKADLIRMLRNMTNLWVELQGHETASSHEARAVLARAQAVAGADPVKADLLDALHQMRDALRSMPTDPFAHGPLASADSIAEAAIARAEGRA